MPPRRAARSRPAVRRPRRASTGGAGRSRASAAGGAPPHLVDRRQALVGRGEVAASIAAWQPIVARTASPAVAVPDAELVELRRRASAAHPVRPARGHQPEPRAPAPGPRWPSRRAIAVASSLSGPAHRDRRRSRAPRSGWRGASLEPAVVGPDQLERRAIVDPFVVDRAGGAEDATAPASTPVAEGRRRPPQPAGCRRAASASPGHRPGAGRRRGRRVRRQWTCRASASWARVRAWRARAGSGHRFAVREALRRALGGDGAVPHSLAPHPRGSAMRVVERELVGVIVIACWMRSLDRLGDRLVDQRSPYGVCPS